jgi:DnaK suppressor protein
MITSALKQDVSTRSYLNANQLHFFANKLRNWRRDLTQILAVPSHLELDSVRQPDWVDEAATKSQLDLNWANRERASRLIQEIDAALERIDSGDYGYCLESGEEIGIKRLLVMPIAKYGVGAQARLEKKLRSYR